jgi:gamma-glutamyltranspeptidase/glutathione hydrolase
MRCVARPIFTSRLAGDALRAPKSQRASASVIRLSHSPRNSYLGDPEFVNNPLARLLDKGYAERIRAAIEPAKAGVSSALKPDVMPHEGTNTTHYSIVDKDGNAVAVTYPLNDWFGARVTAHKTGILLNNEMDDFTSKVGVPNLFGLVQGQANSIAPRKRPLSSMSPTSVSRDGKPVLVVGTPGGPLIISAVVQTIVNVIDFGMNIQESVDAPRIHQQWLPEATRAENFALSPDTRKILMDMGHKFADPPRPTHIAAILIGAPSLGGNPRANNRYYGANDPRRGTGLAQGY